MNPSTNRNGTHENGNFSGVSLKLPVTDGMTRDEFTRAAERAFVLWHMRDRPPIATLLDRLGLSRATLYRDFVDLLTADRVTFNWHPYVKGGFKTSPWLEGAHCERCGVAFVRRKGECIFVKNVETRYEQPTTAYHAACRRLTTAEAKADRPAEEGARHAAVQA